MNMSKSSVSCSPSKFTWQCELNSRSKLVLSCDEHRRCNGTVQMVRPCKLFRHRNLINIDEATTFEVVILDKLRVVIGESFSYQVLCS